MDTRAARRRRAKATPPDRLCSLSGGFVFSGNECDHGILNTLLTLMSPQVPLADVTFIVSTRGVSAFDSYTAGSGLINALLAEYVRLAADSLQARYAIQKKLLRHFDIFVPHRSSGNGRRSAVRQRMTRGNAPPARLDSGGTR